MKSKSGQKQRKTRVREKIKKQGKGRKLSVFRSNQYIWAQIIDVPSGDTIVSANEKSLIKKKPQLKKKTKTERSFEVGKEIATKALKKEVKRVAFDRGSYRYHGRVKALAEGARAGGLKL